ncbi:MAG: DUF1211 domain-containing protein [Candidatus Micrarchaeota archaeon]|nr:DUF1211 domain-containing protein [Candidatus Micrarchaeota archaeon]
MPKQHDHSFNKSRMEALTEGIFATVMTILVLSLVVPVVTGSDLSQQLDTVIFSLLPGILIYVFSFTVLLVMWIGHNNIFRYIHGINPRTLWLNGFFLLLVALVPFSTAFLGRYPLQQPAIFVYGINFLLITIMFRLFNQYVKGYHGKTDSVMDRTSRYNLIGFVTYIGAMAFSFVSPYISIAFFAAVPVFYIYQAFFGMYKDIR